MTDLHIRWMIRRDMPEVLEIENLCFDMPWQDDDFIRTLRRRNVIGMVAEKDGQVIGFMVYMISTKAIEVLNFAVHPSCWRKGVGARMLDKLKAKMTNHGLSSICLDVREENLNAQLFFRESGFRYVAIVRNRFDNGEDAYRFRYAIRERSQCQ